MRSGSRTLLAALLLLALARSLPAQVPSSTEGSTVVLLVRHAETEEDGAPDPHLSDAGRSRAAALTATLASVRLDGVHSSPYHRTRETAEPTAAARGLTAREYDPQQLAALAEQLLRSGGTHLVVGHSNTTPALVAALGGDAGAPIAESEHGRLYVLVIRGQDVRTLLLHLPGP
jgi:broad specificity phosphatase PhoE